MDILYFSFSILLPLFLKHTQKSFSKLIL